MGKYTTVRQRQKQKGRLFGIGVGPGDPELVSVKAIRILKQVSTIFAARSSKNSYSLAKEIISTHIGQERRVVPLDFPMTRSKKILEQAWQQNTRQVLEVLSKGEDAAFVTLGDPLIYSTFGYLMKTVKDMAPDVCIEVVPGISSFQAASAATRTILAEAEDCFVVISGATGSGKLKELADKIDTVVMLKVYKNYKEILSTLKELSLEDTSILVMKCGLEGEKVVCPITGYNGEPLPYLSTLVIKNNKRKSKKRIKKR